MTRGLWELASFNLTKIKEDVANWAEAGKETLPIGLN